ncbi:MAG: hypothetical protein R6U21_08030 [Thermoplasmatota archaeon]
MRFDTKRKKINIFKIGELYCFKQYLDDRELFNELSDYYNPKNYRFELLSLEIRNKVMDLLCSKGFDPILVDDFKEHLVKIDRYKKYGSLLKNSIEHTEFGNDRIFLMKDMVSVEQSLSQGAERYTDEITTDRLIQ